MGVVNVTPDSFSDGGVWFDTPSAVAQGRLLRAQGAQWVDVGGESTRPGALRVDEPEELFGERGIKYMTLAHNTIRGAAGGSLLNAETLLRMLG